LEAIGEGELARQIRDDHAALRELLRASPADRAALARFGERLEAHIRSEEREVFETTQHRLPLDALEAIAAACRATPRSCPAFLAD
jgi:hemerythrin-like domain-containing protein